jgi:hypothetical protein
MDQSKRCLVLVADIQICSGFFFYFLVSGGGDREKKLRCRRAQVLRISYETI